MKYQILWSGIAREQRDWLDSMEIENVEVAKRAAAESLA
jgi:hypothetical protein